MAGYTNIKRHYCSDAASLLSSAFTWEGSPEGGDFWNAVQERLAVLGRGGTPTSPCFKPPPDNNAEIERLKATIVRLNEEIDRQAQRIVELSRKLRIADFVNSSLPRG